MKANDRQVGGRHYKDDAVEPWDYNLVNKLPFMEGSIVKYVTRWRLKDGITDLQKALHYLEKLIEFEGKEKTVITVPNAFKATHRHKGNGDSYEKVSDTKLKIEQGAFWEDAVIYRNHEGEFFVRPITFFDEAFEKLPNNETDGLALDKSQYK